jgi:hypothetical protein
MTSWKAGRRFLVFFSLVAKNDNEPRSQLIVVLDCFLFSCKKQHEPPSSLSFFAFFFSYRRRRRAKRLVNISWFYSLVVYDNKELRSQLVIILGFFLQLQKMTTNQNPSSSSSLGFFLKCRRRRWAKILAHHCFWLFCFSCKRWQQVRKLVVIFYIFFLQVQKTMTS